MSIPAVPAPEAAQSLSALAQASTDALRAAVQELEMVAESHVADITATSNEPAHKAELHVAPDPPQAIEAFAKESPATSTEEPQPEIARSETTKHDEWASSHEEPKLEEPKKEESTKQDRRSESPFAIAAVPQTDGQPLNAEKAEATPSNDIVAQPATAATVSLEPVSSELTAAAANEPVPASVGTAKNESDPSATTAAAWASWRRIRESGDSKAVPEKSSDPEGASATQDVAARAVAAGAEKTPEGSSDNESDPTAIASIVDSVLADLRPRIYEEISRKMGKKK
jgi:hypothetical protein